MLPTRLVSQGQNRTFDYRLAFEYWVECGTRKKAALALHRRGISNLEGDPFNPATIRRAAFIWALEHPEEALAYYWKMDQGYFPDGMDGDDWKHHVCRNIMSLTQSSARLNRLLKLNKAEEFFYEHYGNNNRIK